VLPICDELRKHPNFRTERSGDPIYNDIQCGNGPANDAADEAGCPGRVDLGSEGCDEIGPGFDMNWLESRERFGGNSTNNTETTVTCNGGQSVTYGMGSITMAGGSFYQIFDINWNEVYNCEFILKMIIIKLYANKKLCFLMVVQMAPQMVAIQLIVEQYL